MAIVIDGRAIQGSSAATIRSGIVMAPLDPYLRRIAQSIEVTGEDGGITMTRGDRRVRVRLGSSQALEDDTPRTLPIAPFVRGGEPNIPLATVARALGATVSYDAAAHALYVLTPWMPLATMTPFAAYVPPRFAPTFAPTSTPAPQVVVTGQPRPRRTPILVEPLETP